MVLPTKEMDSLARSAIREELAFLQGGTTGSLDGNDNFSVSVEGLGGESWEAIQ